MSLDDDIRVLSRVRLFEGFESEQLRLLAFGAEERSVAKGDRLFQAGRPAVGGYAVVSGHFELRPPGTEEEEEPGLSSLMRRYGPGSMLGELALISEIEHSADAYALEDARVLKIPRALFRRMLEEYPDLTVLLRERLANETQEFLARLERIRVKLDHADTLQRTAIAAEGEG